MFNLTRRPPSPFQLQERRCPEDLKSGRDDDLIKIGRNGAIPQLASRFSQKVIKPCGAVHQLDEGREKAGKHSLTYRRVERSTQRSRQPRPVPTAMEEEATDAAEENQL